MIENGFCESIDIKYSEIDQNFALKPFSLLNFLQDIASKNAEHLGFGYSFMQPKSLAWFLIKYRMEFFDYPMDVQTLKLVTEPRGYNKLFAYRDFELKKDDKTLARISSVWSVIDTVSHSIVQPATVFDGHLQMRPYIKRDDDLSFCKIGAVVDVSLQKEFEVRYNDLDVNGHANNGNYIVWAFEPLSFEFKNSHKLKTLDMIYKKEARYGEKLISQIEILSETRTRHRLLNLNEEDLCLLECDWVGI